MELNQEEPTNNFTSSQILKLIKKMPFSQLIDGV
jgi:hypothetical protein